MSSTKTALSEPAAIYRKRAACMTLWNTKLSLAIALRDSWKRLDPKQYPEDAAARAEKSMELVTHMVRILLSFVGNPLTTMPRPIFRHGTLASPTVTNLRLTPHAIRRSRPWATFWSLSYRPTTPTMISPSCSYLSPTRLRRLLSLLSPLLPPPSHSSFLTLSPPPHPL